MQLTPNANYHIEFLSEIRIAVQHIDPHAPAPTEDALAQVVSTHLGYPVSVHYWAPGDNAEHPETIYYLRRKLVTTTDCDTPDELSN